MLLKSCLAVLALAACAFPLRVSGQRATPEPGDRDQAVGRSGLSDRPQIFDAGGQRIRVVAIKGLANPWALAVLPNLDIMVTERAGRLRIIRKDRLDPVPIAGLPEVNTGAVFAGLMDVVLHPRYPENKLVYFTYSKAMAGSPFPDTTGMRDAATVTLARARYDGGRALTDVQDIFVSDAWAQGTSAGRIAFTPDGKIILAIGMATRHKIGNADDAQNPANHAGKILRLNDDGTVPADNPFVRTAGYRPEIYALGIRNAIGLFVHPVTGEIWETENGPMGGDELNQIKAGGNYGWPVVSYGKDYNGLKMGGLSGTTTPHSEAPGMEDPFLVLDAVAGGGRPDDLHRRQVPQVEGQHLRGHHGGRQSGFAAAAPHHVEQGRTAAAERHASDAERAQAAHPGREAGPGRSPVSDDGRGCRRGVENRAGRQPAPVRVAGCGRIRPRDLFAV